MWKEAKVTHIRNVRNILGVALGLALIGCTMESKGLSESEPTPSEPQQLVSLGEEMVDSPQEATGPITVAGHHHHKRGHNCDHGWWATDDQEGHHHHKRGTNCIHNVWATDDQAGHHHHKRGDNCPEHNRWATTAPFSNSAVHHEITEEAFYNDPSVPYDLSQTDQRSYEEIEAELATLDQSAQ